MQGHISSTLIFSPVSVEYVEPLNIINHYSDFLSIIFSLSNIGLILGIIVQYCILSILSNGNIILILIIVLYTWIYIRIINMISSKFIPKYLIQTMSNYLLKVMILVKRSEYLPGVIEYYTATIVLFHCKNAL